MIDKIVNIVKNNTELSDYVLTQSVTSSKELFLIKDQLDMNRGTDIEEYTLTVYVDFEEDGVMYRGDSLVNMSRLDSEEEIQEKIDMAVRSAKYIKNKWYPLTKNDDNNYSELEEFDNMQTLSDNYARLNEVIYKDYGFDSRVNSCEIFAVDGYKRVVSSNGTDCKYKVGEFTFEIVTDCNTGSEPVEIFNGYYLTDMNLEKIEKIVKDQLLQTDARSKSKRVEQMSNLNVLLRGDAVEELLDFYLTQASALSIYTKVSRAEIGKSLQSEDAITKLNIKVNPFLKNSIYRRLVDSQATKLSKFNLFEEGVCKNLVSDAMYSHYLGVENKGNVSTFEVAGGEKSVDEFLSEDHLEIITFSSFNLDSTSGDFGGEFRLAKLQINGEVSYITGGAISENIFDVQNRMEFSKELVERKTSLAPEAIRFHVNSVSGGI